MEIFTTGHSTRTLEQLIAALKSHNIELLIDVRHFPHSKHNPQFNLETLEKALQENGIEYLWAENLGGFREGGYLEYTKTREFKEGVEKLKEAAKAKKTAIMCAEILWFRCHRRHIADFLEKEGWKVTHIHDEKRAEPHNPERKRKIKCEGNYPNN